MQVKGTISRARFTGSTGRMRHERQTGSGESVRRLARAGHATLRVARGVQREFQTLELLMNGLSKPHLSSAEIKERTQDMMDIVERTDRRFRRVLKSSRDQLDELTPSVMAETGNHLSLFREAEAFEVAAQAVHDVGNAMTSINASAWMMQRKGETSQKMIDLMKSGVQDARSTLNNLFVDQQDQAGMQRHSAGPLLRNAMDRMGGKFERYLVKASFIEAAGVPDIKASAGDLSRVFDNLIWNAVQAIDGVPRESRPAEARIDIRLFSERDGVGIDFLDNGPGLAPAIQGRLFDAFVSTKGEKGNGLGLSGAKRIVEEHGGSISASNRPEGGARFHIFLPAAE